MRLSTFAMTACFALFAAAPALSATTIQVKLSDMGGNMDMSGSMQLGMGMGKMDMMSMATMVVKVDQTEVPAGEVTFDVTNISTENIHEMLVAPVKDENQPLPYIEAENRVDEDAADHLGEVSDLDPGKAGQLTVTLEPGKYILFCNIPGHYMSGMWTIITVK